MLLIIVAILLILGSAVFHWRQGLFNSGIMALLSLLCAAVALGWYEPLARAVLYDSHMVYADALCLMGLFVLPLLVLRIIIDRLISRGIVFNHWVDSIGGALMGVLTGMLAFGVLFVALQMLPWGPSVIDYQPYDSSIDIQGNTDGHDGRQDSLAPLYPDEFVLGLTKMLSGGTLQTQGEWNFGRAHSDLLRELYCARYRVERTGPVKNGSVTEEVTNRYGRLDARRGELQVVSVMECPDEFVKNWYPGDLRHPLLAAPARRGQKLYVVRVKVSRAAAETESGPVAGWWVLPLPHFRLVTDKGEDFYPLGYLAYASLDNLEAAVREATARQWPKPQEWLFVGPAPVSKDLPDRYQRAELSVDRQVGDKQDWLVIDWVFSLPPDKENRPAFMAFRRAAVAPVPKVLSAKEAAAMIASSEFSSTALQRVRPK
ncbi:MAG: CvpA family protein [Planctomycetaceae bacterium]|nr:CvpA family protein [Planctomycetaceae bacterium]